MMINAILLIDDDADDSELFFDALQEVAPGIRFHRAPDGLGGLAFLAEADLRPDLIMLDINMPRMDGWECLGRLKSLPATAAIPVIMYSTSSLQREKELAEKLGAAGFITKPETFSGIKNMIRNILGSL